MADRAQQQTRKDRLEKVLGYLNFSNGGDEPSTFRVFNELYIEYEREAREGDAAFHLWLLRQLQEELESLHGTSPAFQDISQASCLLAAANLFPQAYREFHDDLLHHQTDSGLFGPFAFARYLNLMLTHVGGGSTPEGLVEETLRRANSYVGHRCVATLETQKRDPYPHEWVCPIPIYQREAGPQHGLYQEVLTCAIDLLSTTGSDLLQVAYFDLDKLDEICIDPRAYDFDHPVNKRPNYHFGQWDPHLIDNQGYYRRFVIQQVTLDSIIARLREGDLPADELMFEAGAVLAGIILMASGVSGNGPTCHSSDVTLGNLLPRIAWYRDEFYERLFQRLSGAHLQRLREEAEEKLQPFGGARQHLNAELARHRASQMERVYLARLYAQMGHMDASERQAELVDIPSARLQCEIACTLDEGIRALERGELARSLELSGNIMSLIHRAIECGAMIDPWNILGCDAQYSLFPALENSVHDHRADELIGLMDEVLNFYSRIWAEAAARNERGLSLQVETAFESAANWWHQFAAHEVSNVQATDAMETFSAAQHVANALNLWHQGGAAAGDVAFWEPHVEIFSSPAAYAMVVRALMERKDFIAAMALLIHWCGRGESIPMEQSTSSLYDLAEQWALELMESAEEQQPIDRIVKFIDYLEANADHSWSIPRFELTSGSGGSAEFAESELDEPLEEETDGNLFEAAYSDMVFVDSTDDGVEGSLFETGQASHDELSFESQRIFERLAFSTMVARLWKLAACGLVQACHQQPAEAASELSSKSLATWQRWLDQAFEYRAHLKALLQQVCDYRITLRSSDQESMLEYDRQRWMKDSLLDRIINVTLEVSEAQRLLAASHASEQLNLDQFLPDERHAVKVFACLIKQDYAEVQSVWTPYLRELSNKPLLYVPLSKSGDPAAILGARIRQSQIQDLLVWLPRSGLLHETCQLIERSRSMEHDNPVGPGAVTEFDELFNIGYCGVMECLIRSIAQWGEPDLDQARIMVNYLERFTEHLLISWLTHSQTLRLSVLEQVYEEDEWDQLVLFVKRYGDQLFTQRFLNHGNIRGILHQGVSEWLTQIQQFGFEGGELRLVEELDEEISLANADDALTLILDAVAENYPEYRDYNSTTTQSDHGELLYTFLDFLRLRSQYDRICWKLKPVIAAHDLLLRNKQGDAARLWRRALTERTQDEASRFMERLAGLQKKYAMRMPTIADHISERFVGPLAIDRMKALVRPAIEEAKQEGPCPQFELLEHETLSLASYPTGVGFDAPPWLMALQEEVENVARTLGRHDFEEALRHIVPVRVLTQDEIDEQLAYWQNP